MAIFKAADFDTCNLQALPIYLDKLFNQFVAIILSVTFVLFFGEVCHWLSFKVFVSNEYYEIVSFSSLSLFSSN